MKKTIIASILLTLAYSCAKETFTANKISGKWNVTSIAVYKVDTAVSNEPTLFNTYSNAGTIELVDENRNYMRKKDPPLTNKTVISFGSFVPGSILYLYQFNSNEKIVWSVDQPKTKKIIKLTFGIPSSSTGLYWYSTFTAEMDGKDKMTLLYVEASTTGLIGADNYDVYREEWTLERVK
jgi:hypothetical protein